MTDSELLKCARWCIDMLTGLPTADLARFVADMLDDSPVTEEALVAMGFYKIGSTYYHDDIPGRVDNQYQWLVGDESVFPLRSIGQLRCLLRGLGVMT